MSLADARWSGTPLTLVEDPDDLWSARPELAGIRHGALVHTISPWSMLGLQLMRALHTVPYRVVYRSALGAASLNAATFMVGVTGGGKGLGSRSADEVVRFEDLSGAPFVFEQAVEVGSGEAIPDQYAHLDRSKLITWSDTSPKHAVMFAFSEVGKLTKLSKRDGTTLLEYIKSGISGEVLGRKLANRAGVILPQDSYRMTLTIAAQPSRLGDILSEGEMAGGLPGRFLWLRATEPDMRRLRSDALAHPVRLPVVIRPAAWIGVREVHATDSMNAWHVEQRYLAAEGKITALAAQDPITRVKVAVALAVLNGRATLDEEDWRLSGFVMAHSRQVRDDCLVAVAETQAMADAGRGRSLAAQNVARDEETARRIARRLVDLVRRHAADERHDGACTQQCLRDALNSEQRRTWLDAALSYARERDWLDVEEIAAARGAGRRTEWRAGPQAPKRGER